MQLNNAVVVKIGKKGVTSEARSNMLKLLKQHDKIKVKFLKTTGLDYDSLPGRVVKKIGRTVILKR